MPDKQYSIEITSRFILAMDKVMNQEKVTASDFGKTVGITGSNLSRLRTSNGTYNVTIEAIGRLCDHYDISPYWLITGKGDMNSNDDLNSTHKIISKKFQEVESAVKTIDSLIKAIKKREVKPVTIKPISNKKHKKEVV